MRLRKVGGSYIEFFPGDFGRYHRYDFTVGFTLDVDEQELSHQIAIYPNPTTSITTIEVEGEVNGQATLRITDLSGRVLHESYMNAGTNFAESFIDVSHYLSGTYLVEIQTNSRRYLQKLIKQ